MGRLFGLAGALCALSMFAQSRFEKAANAIQPSWIAPHVRFLADSALEGRDTGSFGYDVASHYVATQFQLLGLEPAGDHGSYFQTVRIRKTTIASDSAALSVGGRSLPFGRQFFIHAGGDDDGLNVTVPSFSPDSVSPRRNITTTTTPESMRAARSCCCSPARLHDFHAMSARLTR